MEGHENTQKQALAGQINQLITQMWVATERDAPRYAQFELTGQQHVILYQIVKHPQVTPKQLAEQLGVSKGAISQHLTRLEQEGYFVREKSPQDKRVAVFRLRPLGMQYQEVLRQYEQYFSDAYVRTLSLDELKEITEALNKLCRVVMTLGKPPTSPD